MKSLEFEGAELVAHRVDLFHADPVLAGNRAADVDRELKYLGTELLGSRELARLVRIIEDQRVQVAVAGVKNIHTAQAVLFCEVFDRGEDARQRFFRNRAVHAIVIGRHPAGSGKCRLAAGPESVAFGFAARDADFGCPARLHDCFHALDFRGDLGGIAVGFA